jgi:hypothetical protein
MSDANSRLIEWKTVLGLFVALIFIATGALLLLTSTQSTSNVVSIEKIRAQYISSSGLEEINSKIRLNFVTPDNKEISVSEEDTVKSMLENGILLPGGGFVELRCETTTWYNNHNRIIQKNYNVISWRPLRDDELVAFKRP